MSTPFRVFPLVTLWFAAAACAFNHAHIEWQSVTTENFIINYYNRTEPAVYPVWRLAEEAYEALAPLYDYRYKNKITITIASYDDMSNGWAAWLDPSVMLWLPDARFDLRGNTTWLANLVVHELTHIFSLENKRRRQVIALSTGVAYRYIGEDFTAATAVTVPFARTMFYPLWFAEGVAQSGARRLNADCFDSRRDMVLRCALLDNAHLSLDEMGHFVHDRTGNELVYNQGFSFVSFLEQRFGLEAVHGICALGGRSPVDFERAFQARIPTPLRTLWDAWVAHETARVREQLPHDPTQTTVLFDKGAASLLPRVSRTGAYRGWIASDRDAGYRTDLLIFRNTTTTPLVRIPWAHTTWCFSPDESSVYYVTSREPDRNGSFFNELYRYDLATGTNHRLTHGGRVYDAALSADGTTLALVRFEQGSFNLYRADPQGSSLQRVLSAPLGTPFASPSFNPRSSDELVITRIESGNADLYRVQLSTGQLTPVLQSDAQLETPWWGEDGRIWFSADFDGFFDIWSVLPDGSDLRRHTQVAGGAFSPQPMGTEEVLFSEYTSSGFRIAQVATQTLAAAAPPPPHRCSTRALPRPVGQVEIRSTPYRARYLRPVWEVAALGQVQHHDTLAPGTEQVFDGFVGGGFMTQRHDALGKKNLGIGLFAALPFETTYRPGTMGQRLSPGLPVSAHGDSMLSMHERVRGVPPPAQMVAQLYQKEPPAHAPRVSTTRAQNGGDSLPPLPVVLLNPFLSYRNTTRPASFGTNLSVLAFYAIPVALEFSPFVTRRLGREWYCGAASHITVSPFEEDDIVYGELPLWLEWVHYAFIDEDFAYNARQFMLARATITMARRKQRFIDTSPFATETGGVPATLSDTTVETHSLGSAGVEMQGSIPLARRSSLLLSAQAHVERYRDPSRDPARLFSQRSHWYGRYHATADLLFPIVRNINRGSALFADNLYGRAGYTHLLRTNDNWFAPGTAPSAGFVTAGLTLGLIRSYAFGQTLSLNGYYTPDGRYGAVSLSLW